MTMEIGYLRVPDAVDKGGEKRIAPFPSPSQFHQRIDLRFSGQVARTIDTALQ